MKLADKNCYPVFNNEGLPTRSDQAYGNESVPFAMGLTFRERLIIALASNPAIFTVVYGTTTQIIGDEGEGVISKMVIGQADAIIKRLEDEEH